MDEDKEIGKRIAALRTERGLNQGQLSEQLRTVGVNWSQGTLSLVEAGERPVRFTEALAVAKVFGVHFYALAPAGWFETN